MPEGLKCLEIGEKVLKNEKRVFRGPLDPLDPLVFPYRHQAPALAPTLTWRNTDVRGRALLATSLYANDIPLDHSASLFGASLRVIWVNMRPRRLQVPIPLTLSGTQFTYAARIFSGHCPSPYYYGKMGLFGYSASCPCGFPIGSSAHIVLATSTTGSCASSAPASLPGGGSQTEYWGLQVRLPHGFKWIKIPHNHHTVDLRTAIAIHACAYEEYTPTDLVDNLRAEGLYDISLADAYYDYYRLRASYRHERDPSTRAIIDRPVFRPALVLFLPLPFPLFLPKIWGSGSPIPPSLFHFSLFSLITGQQGIVVGLLTFLTPMDLHLR
ncbi:hypothetical protein BOTBODRAFT_171272 [Botryobasidium botryosum FD-172 SS1]|uniref:Uncharacterized protein n=1 Tax=Botryobasidium botryosum (strain FD-172 SS1) TaxID=930990 RepID=A0A067N3U6_BOTB1|nr:hypothetical protein BOTBODRAFT_171272 [Botryobasidium botryosum FD-172 SS1]